MNQLVPIGSSLSPIGGEGWGEGAPRFVVTTRFKESEDLPPMDLVAVDVSPRHFPAKEISAD